MSLKTEAIKRFLQAARSLANQGMSKEAIMNFAKNEFGEISELFKKQIDIIFKRPASGIEKIKIKDEVFDDTVVKLPFDDTGQPFNPKDPLKQYGTPKKSIKERMDDIKDTSKKLDDAIKEYEDIYKPKKPEDKATGGRAGYQTGNQVTPQVDARMNLNYDTLIDQNEAQKAIQAQNRNPFKNIGFLDTQRHFDNNQLLKNAVARGELSSADYNRLGGYDVAQTMGGGNPVLGGIGNLIGSTAYNAYQSIKDGQPILEGIKDIGRNVQGGAGLISDDLKAQYESIINPTVDQDRISEIVEQQKAAGVPDEGLITNFQQDDGSSVIPNFEKLSDGTYKDMRSGDIYGAETYASIAAGMYPNIYDPNSQTLAKGGRAGHYTGGIVDVEPSLSDIGHGSDALMSRTRLMSPGSQATTSTGLNYLLAEDNDNIRVPFSKGKIAKELLDKGRRGFMKTVGSIGAGIAGLKAGLLGFGDQAVPVAEKVIKSAGSGQPPSYFFKLVEKIKTLGDDVTEKAATTERQKVTKYKDYELTEDVATGEQTIQKIKTDGPEYYDETLAEEIYMNYKPGKSLADEGTKGIPADEYVEDTGYLRITGPNKGELFDSADGLTDDSLKEIMEEIGEVVIKKASGGRIGYSKGKAVLSLVEILKDPKKIREAIDNIFKTGDYKMDAEMAAESLVELNPQAFGGKLYDDLDDKTRMQVYGAVIDDVMKDVGKKIKEKKTDTYKFLEKVFGKENMSEMPNRDPLMYEGLKEVVPMFRQKDKARKKQELIMYMQKYLPHMDDAEIETFIKGSDGTEGLQGQLIRLGSGRDYAEKMEMMNNLERNRSLRDLEVTEEMKRKPNASGGVAKLLGE
jgi:hypothetical protein